jgi:hypothetical protein
MDPNYAANLGRTMIAKNDDVPWHEALHELRKELLSQEPPEQTTPTGRTMTVGEPVYCIAMNHHQVEALLGVLFAHDPPDPVPVVRLPSGERLVRIPGDDAGA